MRILLSVLAIAFVFTGPVQAVTIDWVTVGEPGNAADTTGFGAVADVYRISKYEVTNAQYAEFLNAVDPTGANTLALYNGNMGAQSHGGIDIVSGNSAGSKYVLKSGMTSKPANYVSFYDSLRFANWLHNGQGTGSTETGAYTLLGGTPIPSNGRTVTRNVGATIFLPSEDEWYKAAYYDAVAKSYFDYPAGMDTQTVCAAPGVTVNAANCNFAAFFDFTDVGSYTGSPSPNGTFDQGGNVWEWNEAIVASIFGPAAARVLRGGSFIDPQGALAASLRAGSNPADEDDKLGFRVASIPEPAMGLLGLAFHRRANDGEPEGIPQTECHAGNTVKAA